MHKYGPKSALSPTVGELCVLCARPLVAGDYTTFFSVTRDSGNGRHSNSPAEVHWQCAQQEHA